MAERKKIFSRKKPRPHQRKTTFTNPITGRTRVTTKSKFKKDAETSYGTDRPRVKKRTYVKSKDGVNIKSKSKKKETKLGWDKKSVKVKDTTKRPSLYKPSINKRKEFNFDQDTGGPSGKRKVVKDKFKMDPIANPFNPKVKKRITPKKKKIYPKMAKRGGIIMGDSRFRNQYD